MFSMCKVKKETSLFQLISLEYSESVKTEYSGAEAVAGMSLFQIL